MSLHRLLARRLALGLATIWAVLTAMFALFTLTDDWAFARREGALRFGGADETEIEAAREAYLAERGLDQPIGEAYVDWLWNTFTLQWGDSFASGDAATAIVADATLTSAAYVLPGVALAVVVAVLLGTHSAMGRGSTTERTGRSAAYLLFGLPNFWLGAIIVVSTVGIGGLAFRRHSAVAPAFDLPFALEYALPAMLVATTLLGALLSHARAHSLEYVSVDLTRLVRAKGGNPVVVARHVLRNAAIPLVSLLFTETLALLVLAVFVIEVLLGIDGIGLLFYNAVWVRDLPVLLGGTMVILVVGVVGNVLQDLGYSALDPRVDTGSR